VIQTIEPLILDLLEWIGPHSRPYAEVIDAWHTSCPGLPVWEEANERGLIRQHRGAGGETHVSVSDRGAEYLRRNRKAL
jgi:D-3-phosphoglycerate dehydrogenase